MPIHLSQISRRQFLRRTFAAGTAAAFAPHLFAETKSVDPHRWIFLSDTHIAADKKSVQRGANMAENLARATREIAALDTRPSAFLVNGDCAFNTGELADYAAFTVIISPLRTIAPLHLTLGNHDHREHFWNAVSDVAKDARPVEDHHVSLVRSPRANWFLLDTLEKTNSTPGILGEAQLAWLEKSLDANADKPAIIVGHHNLQNADEKGALKDTTQLLKILEPRRHVKAYIFGHTHHWSNETHASGIHLINLPPIAYLFKATDPNGWVTADLKSDGVNLRLQCFDETHSANQQKVELKWRA